MMTARQEDRGDNETGGTNIYRETGQGNTRRNRETGAVNISG